VVWIEWNHREIEEDHKSINMAIMITGLKGREKKRYW